MLLYTTSVTPRLKYSSDFIGKELVGDPFELTTDLQRFRDFSGPKINYSAERTGAAELWLKPHTLLFEKTIGVQDTSCIVWNDKKIFFTTDGDIPFDVFAACFFLLSRYEEYLPHQLDAYGRYDHLQSLAYTEGFLHLPLINNWLEDIKQLFRQKFPQLELHQPSFTFLPTYDIDMAWVYRHKGWWRSTGGLLRALLQGRTKEFGIRWKVLWNKQKDPYDVFGWMNSLHEQHQLRPYYFFLLAARPGRYDKNIDPSGKEMKALIADHLIRYPVGIHPSWQSGDDPALLKKEIASLSAITGNSVRSSRQHFIRMKMPDTYRLLGENNIQFDFSMGYGGINGFRASVASPFNWYDLQQEQPSPLVLFPFCYMEATSFYELKQDPAQALEEMRYYYDTVKNVNGLFSMIWHNSFMSDDELHAGWKEMYVAFIEGIKKN